MPELSLEEFEKLYIENYRVVRYRVSKFIEKNIPLFIYDENDDLVEDIFTAVHKAWKKYDGKRTQADYVQAVTTNFLRNELRKRIRRKEKDKALMIHQEQPHIPIKDLEKALKEEKPGEGEQYIRVEPQKKPVTQQEALIIKYEAKTILKELIEELEKQDKKLADVIKLYRLCCTDKEIGKRLNIPDKTIFHWRIKALELLKKLLKKRGIESIDDIIEIE